MESRPGPFALGDPFHKQEERRKRAKTTRIAKRQNFIITIAPDRANNPRLSQKYGLSRSVCRALPEAP